MKLVTLLLIAGLAFAQFGQNFFNGLDSMVPGCGGQGQGQAGLWGAPSGEQQGGNNFWGTPSQDASGYAMPQQSSGYGAPSQENKGGWGAPVSLFGNCYPGNPQQDGPAAWVSNPFGRQSTPSQSSDESAPSSSGKRDPNVVCAQTGSNKPPEHEVTEDPERVRQIMESLGMMTQPQKSQERAEEPAPKKASKECPPQKKLAAKKAPARESEECAPAPERKKPAMASKKLAAPKVAKKAQKAAPEEAPEAADNDGYKPYYRGSVYANDVVPLCRPTKMQVPVRDAGRSRCDRFFPQRHVAPKQEAEEAPAEAPAEEAPSEEQSE